METRTTTLTLPSRMPIIAAPEPPPIVQRLVPYGEARKADMAAYSRRHYGLDTWRLRDPQAIVLHFTVNDSLRATYDAFAPNRPDPELREKPGVCAHLGVGRDGTVWQFARLSFMCRHTVGLNHTALGVEAVGFSAREIRANRRQYRTTLRLLQWLRCREGLAVSRVIGHNENRESPFHRERIARLRTQTHGDWTRAEMRLVRRDLSALGAC
jgi:N-acetylmuramoyl-L-alanine amidase